MYKIFLAIFLTFCLSLFIVPESYAGVAENLLGGDGTFSSNVLGQTGAGFDTSDKDATTKIGKQIGTIIKNVLNLLGVIVLIFVIYAGFMWLTAGGNTEKVTTAKKILMNCFIGAIIIGMAYAITALVIVFSQ